MRITLLVVFLIWALFELFQSTIRYRKDKERIEFVSLIASIIMIPAGIILLISEILNK